MTENPWLPIDTMPLSTVGTKVDLKHGDHAWTVELTGIDVELHSMPEWLEMHLSTTGMTECVDINFEWRPHVPTGSHS